MKTINFTFQDEDFEKCGEVKISSILKYMQNAAIEDAEQFGASRENLLNENMFFAVYRNIVKIKQRIKKENSDTRSGWVEAVASSLPWGC